jgi:hypothetical protein
MHPYIVDLYLMTLREERERQAEHERLLASANRRRRKRVRCHPGRCDRRYAQTGRTGAPAHRQEVGLQEVSMTHVDQLWEPAALAQPTS